MLQKFKLFMEKFGEAWTACMICMVEGNLSVLSINHAITASKTGTLTGLAVVVASFLPFQSLWISVFLTGMFTMIADIVIHPTHFGPEWMEAAVTGLGAMVLAILFDRLFKKST